MTDSWRLGEEAGVAMFLLEEMGDCSRDSGFDMDRAGDRFYTTAPNLFGSYWIPGS
jgi:hypothetical protein